MSDMAPFDKENHAQFEHDKSFSSPGDVDRVTGSNTSERSRAANAAAADTENSPPQWERANGSEPVGDHAYGRS